MTDLRRSPLHDRHVALGAKMADFGGWEMPIEYPGGGVVKEHTAVREAVGRLRRQPPRQGRRCAGRARRRTSTRRLTNDLGRIGPGQAQYTLCCDDATGGVVDDLIAYLPRRRRGLPRSRTPPTPPRWSAGWPTSAPDGRRGRRPARAATACSPCRGRAAARCSTRSGCRPSHDYMSFADADWQGDAGRRVPHRLHRRARLRAAAALGRRRRALGRGARGRASRTASGRAGSAPATRCAPRWATRCTGRTSRWTSRRCRRACGWAVGWKKPAFWGRDALLAEKEAGAAPAAVGPARRWTAASRGRTWRCRRGRRARSAR